MKNCHWCGCRARPTYIHAYQLRVATTRGEADGIADAMRQQYHQLGWRTSVTPRRVRAAGTSLNVYAVTTRRAVPHVCDPFTRGAYADRMIAREQVARQQAMDDARREVDAYNDRQRQLIGDHS